MSNPPKPNPPRPRTRSTGEARPTGILVVGMHRSGTSALARTVNLLGGELPNDVLGPSSNNPLGHWEPRVSYELHNEILEGLGSSWNALSPIPEPWFETAEADAYVVRIAAFLKREFAAAKMFVLKDPRLCLLFPLWVRAFTEAGMDLRVLVPLRPPIEVARSLNVRNGMPISQGRLVWLRNVLQGERLTRGTPRHFLSYEGLLTDWRASMRTAADVLGIDWPEWSPEAEQKIDAFLQPDQRHQVAGSRDEDDAPAWVMETARALNDLITEPHDPVIEKALDAIRREFDPASAIFEAVIQDRDAQLNPTRDTIASAISSTETAKRKLFDVRAQLVAAREEAALSRAGQEAAKVKLFQARAQLDVAQDALARAVEGREAAKERLTTTRAQLEVARDALAVAVEGGGAAKEKLTATRAQLEAVEAQLAAAVANHENTKRKLTELRHVVARDGEKRVAAAVKSRVQQ